MTKMEDLPLKRDDTVSFTITVNRALWPQREALVIADHAAAVDLAYLTIGFGTYVIDVASMTYEFIDTITGIPEDMFGIKYTWNVYFAEEVQ